jgi:hypothetical protein
VTILSREVRFRPIGGVVAGSHFGGPVPPLRRNRHEKEKAQMLEQTAQSKSIREKAQASSAALRALEKLRKEIGERAGKPEGHLNEKCQSWCDTIEATLRQIEPLQTCIDVVNQQSEVAVRMARNLTRPQLTEGNGDDGTSETKGV